MPSNRFVVVGLGNFGGSAAETLYEEGHDVIGLDVKEERADAMASHVSRSAVGDGRERDTLETIGADGADGAIVATGDDITASILTTLALKDLGLEELYVKVVSRDHARVVEHMGCTDTIFPERESAINLASRLSDQGVINYVRMGADLSVQEMVVPDPWQGRTLRDLSLRADLGLTAIAIHNVDTDEVSVPPDPDQALTASDALLIAGREAELNEAASAY
jgi:trk system potassium uptake protein TrkA